jgi:hypothetical protein
MQGIVQKYYSNFVANWVMWLPTKKKKGKKKKMQCVTVSVNYQLIAYTHKLNLAVLLHSRLQ